MSAENVGLTSSTKRKPKDKGLAKYDTNSISTNKGDDAKGGSGWHQ